jgi:hypothetical protein
VAAAKTPPPVAVGSPPLSPFYMLLSIVDTHLCCAAVLPVFSPIIYVITYSDGLCHPTYIDFLAAYTSASNFALIINLIIVSCLLARQPIDPLKNFMANAYELLRSVLLSAKNASLATTKLF